ncbi:response regulator [candidate division KSB1 bacterium]|nr:response regulator [candidate division KSB1 bacterium]
MNSKLMNEPAQILLIEDNESDVRLTQEAFKDKRSIHQIHHVSDGVEALEFLHREGKFKDAPRPDLILLDLNLPRKDGREVLQEIKLDPELKRIPVIVLTTSSADEDVFKCYDLHANCYLKKPVNMDEFYHIAELIENFWFKLVRLP